MKRYSLKQLNRIASFLGFAPPSDLEDGPKCNSYKIYSLCVMLLAITGYLISMVVKVKYYYVASMEVLTTIDILLNSSLLMGMVMLIVRSTFIDFGEYKLMTQKFIEIDTVVQGKLTESYYQFFNSKLIAIPLEVIIIFANDIYVWYPSVGYLTVPIFFPREILIFANLIGALWICYNGSLIKSLFSKFNDHFTEVLTNIVTKSKIVIRGGELSSSKEVFYVTDELKQMRYLFDNLIQLTRMFNAMFGWQTFAIYQTIFIGFLEVVNLIIQLIMRSPFYENVGSTRFYVMIVTCILWLMCFMVMGIVVAVTCDMTTKEAQRTANVCYNLLLEVPALSNNIQERVLRKELVLLAQQATHQCPNFSAAGFFNVDYTMLFGLLGTVTSYVIVLIQINK